MSHEAWFRRLKEACEKRRRSCKGDCMGVGYCQECFDEARVTRRGKCARAATGATSLEWARLGDSGRA